MAIDWFSFLETGNESSFSAKTPEEIKRTIREVAKGAKAQGDPATAMANTIYGINHEQIGNPVKSNSDNHGLTFFTRPRLNLTSENLSFSRIMSPLLVNDENNLLRAIRVYLDPDSAKGHSFGPDPEDPAYKSAKAGDIWTNTLPRITSNMVDNNQAFISLLSNNLVSLSGWPDMSAETYTSPEGVVKETWSMIDSAPYNYGTFDLTASFKNITGDPITAMFWYWIKYATMVREGSLVPYSDMIIENEMDYCTRIYRLVLNQSRTHVQRIAACGYAFPYSVPTGSHMNYNREGFINQDNTEISVPFKCQGNIYNDPILVREFNAVVRMFNHQMQDTSRDIQYYKLKTLGKELLNYRGYPRINPVGYELEWWVEKTTVNAFADLYSQYVGVNVTPSMLAYAPEFFGYDTLTSTSGISDIDFGIQW